MEEDSDVEGTMEAPELPVEIIVYILSFLHASDRKEASLVCHSWYSASQDLRFQKNITFRFPASASALELVRGLGRKPCCSLVISQLDGFTMSKSLLLEVAQCLGSKLESLALPGSSITEASLLALLPRLTSLRRLDLQGLDSLFMSGVFLCKEEHRQQVPDLVLKELCFHGCKELTDYSVEALVKHQPSLQRLDISACTDLTSRSVVAIAWGLKSLTHLSVSHDWRITEKGLAELLSVPSLRSLDLSECVHVNGTEIVKGLMGSNASRAQLKIINLRSCNYIRDLSVFSLAQLLGDTLCELDLTSCISVTDLSVRAIATYLQRLVVLRLGWCKQVTDWGLLGMVEMTMCEPDKDRGDKDSRFTRTFGNMGFFKPPCLPFEARPKLVTETDLEQFKQQAGASLLALSRLQELDLSSCSRLTDSSITQVMRYPDLQRLSLSMLPEITNASLVSVARHCRSLTSLALSHCPGISDCGVAKAAPYLHRLQHLYLSCCNNITDRSLAFLVQHCKRLRTLDISRCQNISVTAVDLLQSQLPFLENVHCKFIGGADD